MSTATGANKGYHPILERDHPYIFVDSCMQAWPDADYANAHRHGVTAYAVTGWRPHATVEQALEEGMFWHLVARKHPNLIVAEEERRAGDEGGGDGLAQRCTVLPVAGEVGEAACRATSDER